jgi:hypothetical protein
VGLLGNASRLFCCLGLQFRKNQGTFFARFLTDAVGFGACFQQLCLVLLQGGVGFGLCGLCLLKSTRDGRDTVLVGLLECRGNVLDHQEQQDSEACGSDKNFPRVRKQRVCTLTCSEDQFVADHSHSSLSLKFQLEWRLRKWQGHYEGN